MPKYNRALDRVALAMVAFNKGKPELAARMFAHAMREPDATTAIKIIEASNAHAVNEEKAKLAASKLAASKRLKADADFVEEVIEDDEDEIDAEADDVEQDPLDEVEESEDIDDEVDDEEDPEDLEAKVTAKKQVKAATKVDAGKQMGAVLAKMVRKSK